MENSISKDYYWEMSHRLPFHKGLCKNIHGHSYKLRISLYGTLNENKMILDFYDLNQILNPLINKLDHSFICDDNDNLMYDFLHNNGFKYIKISGFTTVENLLDYIISEIIDEFKKIENIKKMKIRIYETIDAFAEKEVVISL